MITTSYYSTVIRFVFLLASFLLLQYNYYYNYYFAYLLLFNFLYMCVKARSLPEKCGAEKGLQTGDD